MEVAKMEMSRRGPVALSNNLDRVVDTELVMGLSSLMSAECLATCLRRLGIAATIDIGRRGWPATVQVDVDLAGPLTRADLLSVGRQLDPSCRRLPARTPRRESVRVAARRASSAPPGIDDGTPPAGVERFFGA